MRLPIVMFDFGNVLGFFDYGLIYARFGARLGLSASAFHELVESKGMSALLAEFEAGDLTPEDFAAKVQREVGLDLSYEDFVSDWQDIFELNEPIARLVVELKAKGYTLLLGSNTNAIHAAFYRRRFRETLDHFDHFVLSHEVRAMKPSRAFFDACTAVVGVPAASCVFIDDVAENIEGARAAGLQGVVYKDPAGLKRDLQALGVETSSDSPSN
ncbi:HAD family hydrolase [Paludisphaera rhizosphaerae]|uniref:HAD family hydrolase n=1 Tax=Paludisphaera rhizosphaerae TaxID=2711216 RepID=UPI0013EA7109|nr:HAD family phosphatase [Paludisphaera rhizosphaerae]